MTARSIPIRKQTVDMRTGAVTCEKTIRATLLIGKPKEGHCGTCFAKHEPEAPHDPTSLPYQYSFYGEHGRWPDWRDAMSHCAPEVVEAWTAALTDYGIDVAGGKLRPERP